MKISPYKFISLSYKLYAVDDMGEDFIEEATAERPFDFIFGTGNMLEAFEKNLSGLSAGDSFDFILKPEEAYGEYNENAVVEVPKKVFEIDGVFDEEMIQEEAIIPMMNEDGAQLNGEVISINDDSVTMDFNHPLAGDSLHFAGVVNVVREPSQEEIKFAQNPHGNGGCDCGSCSDSDCASRN